MSTVIEFTKLSEVPVVETVDDTANVLVENGGEIQRVPKSQVGGASTGGYVYYSFNSTSTHLYKSEDGTYSEATEQVTEAELQETYKKSPIMLLCDGGTDGGDLIHPLLNFSYSVGYAYLSYVKKGIINSSRVNFPTE